MTLRERAIEYVYRQMLEETDGSIRDERLRQMAEAHVDTVLSPLWDRGPMLPHWKDRGYRASQRPAAPAYQFFRGQRDRDGEDKRRVEVNLVSADNMRLMKARRLLEDRADITTERQQEAYRLREIDGMTYAAAGRVMGISAKNVRKLVTKFEGGNKVVERLSEGEERSVISLPTTAMPKALLDLTLNLDDLADVTHLPAEHLQAIADAGAFDGALVGDPARLRPYTAALALLANEVGLLVEAKTLTLDEAAETVSRARPLAEELFAEALLNAKDCRDVVLTVLKDGSQVTLNFHRQAAIGFLELLLAAKAR